MLRGLLAGVLLFGMAWPLAHLLGPVVRDPQVWDVWFQGPRWQSLLATSLTLLVGVLVLVMPLALALAILLTRTDLPARAWLLSILLLALFIPLPIWTTAWQTVLGRWGWWGAAEAGQPWATGLRAAIPLHALAGLPWAVWLIALGLLSSERELEEDALLAMPPWRVLWRVTLPRAGWALFAAACWLTVMTLGEITITDMTQVRTFAEVVYLQTVLPDPTWGATLEDGIARAIVINLPVIAGLTLVLAAFYRGLRRARAWNGLAGDVLIRLGRARVVVALGIALALLGLFAVPMASVLGLLGEVPGESGWSLERAVSYLSLAWRSERGVIVESLLLAAVVGGSTAGLALISAWLMRDSVALRILLGGLVVVTWATPAPVLGVGLSWTIETLMRIEEGWVGDGPIKQWLYLGPSYAPVYWVAVARLLPFALVLMVPAFEQVPRARIESARVDGAGPVREFCRVIWPAMRRAWLLTALVVAILALGELSASKIVATPQGETLIHLIFTRMHTGVASYLAALVVWQVVLVLLLGGLVLRIARPWGSAHSASS